jgi:phosphoadenosine phosphosulfate reductase
MVLRHAPDLERCSPEQVLEYVVDAHHPRLYLAASFQKESSVLLDMLLRVEPEARVFTIDTGALFPETHDTWRRIEERYGITVDVYRGEWLQNHWERDAEACCGARKVAPLTQALGEVDAWISGLRRDQSATRATTAKLGWDEKNGKWKACPLADWTEKDVWRYIFEHDIPYHPLHNRGYSSIGCTHCTQPGTGRNGRWNGTHKIECGLHFITDPPK